MRTHTCEHTRKRQDIVCLHADKRMHTCMRLKLNHNGVQVVVKWAHDMDLGPAHAVLIFVPGVSLHVGAVGEGHVEGQTREDADVIMQAGELEGSVASVVGSRAAPGWVQEVTARRARAGVLLVVRLRGLVPANLRVGAMHASTSA